MQDKQKTVKIEDMPKTLPGKKGIRWAELFRELPKGEALVFDGLTLKAMYVRRSAAYKSAWYLTNMRQEPTYIKTKVILQEDGTYQLFIWKIEKEK